MAALGNGESSWAIANSIDRLTVLGDVFPFVVNPSSGQFLTIFWGGDNFFSVMFLPRNYFMGIEDVGNDVVNLLHNGVAIAHMRWLVKPLLIFNLAHGHSWNVEQTC